MAGQRRAARFYNRFCEQKFYNRFCDHSFRGAAGGNGGATRGKRISKAAPHILGRKMHYRYVEPLQTSGLGNTAKQKAIHASFINLRKAREEHHRPVLQTSFVMVRGRRKKLPSLRSPAGHSADPRPPTFNVGSWWFRDCSVRDGVHFPWSHPDLRQLAGCALLVAVERIIHTQTLMHTDTQTHRHTQTHIHTQAHRRTDTQTQTDTSA